MPGPNLSLGVEGGHSGGSADSDHGEELLCLALSCDGASKEMRD